MKIDKEKVLLDDGQNSAICPLDNKPCKWNCAWLLKLEGPNMPKSFVHCAVGNIGSNSETIFNSLMHIERAIGNLRNQVPIFYSLFEQVLALKGSDMGLWKKLEELQSADPTG